jgi:hypothetical protein
MVVVEIRRMEMVVERERMCCRCAGWVSLEG